MRRIFSKLLYEIEEERNTMLVTVIADRGSAPRGAACAPSPGGGVCGLLNCIASFLSFAPGRHIHGFDVHKTPIRPPRVYSVNYYTRQVLHMKEINCKHAGRAYGI